MFLLIDIFPLLAIPLLIYNFVVLTGIAGGPENVQAWLAGPVFTIHAFSGDAWDVSTGDILILFGILLLFVEVVKSTRTDALSLINHGLAALVFVFFLVQFLTMHGFTTSVFCILMAMQLVDVVAGYTVTAVAARRDIGSSGGILPH
jgi:predicted exporter